MSTEIDIVNVEESSDHVLFVQGESFNFEIILNLDKLNELVLQSTDALYKLSVNTHATSTKPTAKHRA